MGPLTLSRRAVFVPLVCETAVPLPARRKRDNTRTRMITGPANQPIFTEAAVLITHLQD
jgi:hypothetical protein